MELVIQVERVKDGCYCVSCCKIFGGKVLDVYVTDGKRYRVLLPNRDIQPGELLILVKNKKHYKIKGETYENQTKSNTNE